MVTPCPVHTNAQKTPEALAIVTNDVCFTWHQIEELVNTVYQSLTTLEAYKGATLVSLLPNSVEGVVLILAAIRALILIGPVNSPFPPA